MRPRGEINQAMASAWQQGPATVTEAAHRACVGLSAARYTASRMVCRGQLVVVHEGRPAVLGVPAHLAEGPPPCSSTSNYFAALSLLHKSFWENSK